MSGTDLFNKVQDTLPEIPFILITAFGSTENAIEAVKKAVSPVAGVSITVLIEGETGTGRIGNDGKLGTF